MKKRRFAIVGTGARVTMFLDPLVSRFRDSSELVGMCDASPTRMDFHLRRIATEYSAPPVPKYSPQGFEQMIQTEKPHYVIVCTPDASHHDYIIRALDQGVDVISEKPLTTDSLKCQAIFEAVRRTGRSVRTTFNSRWMPGPTRIREIILSGVIGKIKQVQFEYMLNTSHGADYFRRWHSQKEVSGGLLIHKSTHHFDLINWWIDAIPEKVYATGGLVFYGRANAVARGLESFTRYERYTGEIEAKNDPFRLDLEADPRLHALYKQAEVESGYIRDRNVFRDNINIEDLMSVMVNYRNGVTANYSLNAFSPVEGLNVSITGDKGRLEYSDRKTLPSLKEGSNPADFISLQKNLKVIPHLGEAYVVPIEKRSGGHDGSDSLIQEQIFGSNPPEEHLGRNAGHEQGAASLLIGAAANRSMETGLPVRVDDLLQLGSVDSFAELI